MPNTNASAICHVEIAVLKSKLEQVKTFYQKIFGWEIDFTQLPEYGLTSNLDVSVGLPVREKLDSTKSSVYIQVDDITSCLKLVENNGGQVISTKNKISDDIGFGASFRDPSGIEVGLFSPT